MPETLLYCPVLVTLVSSRNDRRLPTEISSAKDTNQVIANWFPESSIRIFLFSGRNFSSRPSIPTTNGPAMSGHSKDLGESRELHNKRDSEMRNLTDCPLFFFFSFFFLAGILCHCQYQFRFLMQPAGCTSEDAKLFDVFCIDVILCNLKFKSVKSWLIKLIKYALTQKSVIYTVKQTF